MRKRWRKGDVFRGLMKRLHCLKEKPQQEDECGFSNRKLRSQTRKSHKKEGTEKEKKKKGPFREGPTK